MDKLSLCPACKVQAAGLPELTIYQTLKFYDHAKIYSKTIKEFSKKRRCDCTNDHERRIKGFYKQIGYSAGVYGCNGMLLQDESGQLYAITSRTTAIYIY